MAAPLPHELLHYIADDLTEQECYVCQLVCKNWFPVFRRKCYRVVKIEGRKQFRRFLAALESSARMSCPIGNAVAELYMTQHGFSQEDFEKLPTLLPNLEVFDFPYTTWRHLRFGDHVKPWKKLRVLPDPLQDLRPVFSIVDYFGPHLTKLVVGKWSSKDITMDELLPLLAKCPNVRQLEVSFNQFDWMDGNGKTVTAQHLFEFDRLLPQLRKFRLESVIFQGTADDLPKAHTVFRNLDDMDFFGSSFNATCADVFTAIFSNVKTLKIFLHHTVTGYALKMLIRYIATRCKRLHSVWMFGHDSPDPPSPEEVLDLFEATGQTYRWLGLSPVPMDNRKQTLTRVLNLQHPDAKRIHTRVWPLEDTREFINYLTRFHCLSDLCLRMFDEVYNVPVNMDVLLTSLPHLENFEVYMGTVSAGAPESEPQASEEEGEDVEQGASNERQHPLKSIKLDKCELSQAAISYLARTCHGLRKIRFIHMYLDVNDDYEMDIFLPSADLEYLQLDDIHQSMNGIAFRMYMDSHHLGQHSTILCLMQMEEWRRRIFRQNDRDMSIRSLQRWYHEYKDPRSAKFNNYVQRISAQDVQAYKDVDLPPMPFEEPQVNNKWYWEHDLFYGTVRVLCRSVKNVTFNRASIEFKCPK